MSKVAIITDSTAYIPEEFTRGLPITIVPLQVIWGEKIYLDGIDIKPTEFYTRLQNARQMPSTSQVTPQTFKREFARLLEEGYDILVIVISSKLSGTLDSAIQAKAEFPGAAIELVDSMGASMALGFPVLAAAQAAKEGATLSECKALAEGACKRSGAFFVVSTLEFLHRGGRIGGAAAFLGTALNLKPLLKLNDGKIEPVERVRTMGKAIDRLLDLFASEIDGRTPLRIASLHANSPREAEMLLEKIRQRFDVSEVDIATLAEVSPVIGTHTGPGTVGIAFMAGI